MQDETKIKRLSKLFLIATNRCNARCNLCSYWREKPPRDISPQLVEEKIIPLIDRYKVGVTIVTGGEPTLHADLVDILEKLHRAGTSVTLITNGSGLDRVFAQIKNYVSAYLLSLDAATAEMHYKLKGLQNFEELIAWPKRIKAVVPGAQVAYSCLLQKGNIGSLVDFYRRVTQTPCDAVFFNVPELKPQCFGRGDKLPEETLRGARLDKRELTLLEENLERIMDLDFLQGKLAQGGEYFNECIDYFRFLLGYEIEGRDTICPIPFSTLTIHETGAVSPCFYLPFSVPMPEEVDGGDIANHDYLVGIRSEIINNKSFRDKYCRHCMQFQG